MCGRSSLTKTEKELEARFHASFYSEDLERYNPLPNFNVAPTHRCPVITNADSGHIQLYKWGLIPSWSKDEKMAYNMINARVESLVEKKTFTKLLESQRCIVPMDGFYEWKKKGKDKTPYRIQTTDQEIFSVAGLFDLWKDSKGEIVHTYTIITLPANSFMSQIHDRMPAILNKNDEVLWIDNALKHDEHLQLLQPYNDDQLCMYEVISKIGNVRENDASLIEKIIKKDNPIQGSLFD